MGLRGKAKDLSLKPYYAFLKGDDYGVAVVARSARIAKVIAHKFLLSEYCLDREEAPWTDCMCRKNRGPNIDLSGLEEGPYDELEEGIRRGLYTNTEDGICDDCKIESALSRYIDNSGKGHALCDPCKDRRIGQDGTNNKGN